MIFMHKHICNIYCPLGSEEPQRDKSLIAVDIVASEGMNHSISEQRESTLA